jgi:hypothetical protein
MSDKKRSACDISSAAAGRNLQSLRHRPSLGYGDAAELLLQLSCPSKQIASLGRLPASEKTERYHVGGFVIPPLRGSIISPTNCSTAVDNERNESIKSQDNDNSAVSARQDLDDVRQAAASKSLLKDYRRECTKGNTVPKGASRNMTRQNISPLAIPPELPKMRQQGLSSAFRKDSSSETKDRSVTPKTLSMNMTPRNMSPLAAPPQLPNVKFGSIVKRNP